ncbi:MAG: DinB family protein [Chitinophagaceae bacterium]|nr:MAG: DinB family protein [Chitinophagaceae bacterium]
MKNVKTNDLLEELKAETRQFIMETKILLQHDPELLTRQPVPGKWSIAQILEHLNAYGRFYIPVIGKALNESQLPPDVLYSSGWLGNFFTNSMKPTPDKVIKNKMKAMKNYTAPPDLDSKAVIDEFLQQQQAFLNLLEIAGKKNIAKIRIPITITKLIRLRLGDTFRFLVAHNQRHFVQCDNTIKALDSKPAGFVEA